MSQFYTYIDDVMVYFASLFLFNFSWLAFTIFLLYIMISENEFTLNNNNFGHCLLLLIIMLRNICMDQHERILFLIVVEIYHYIAGFSWCILIVQVNEAFAPQYLSVERELGLDPERTNVNGGAIAIGHPVGASGSRITAHLVHELRWTIKGA